MSLKRLPHYFHAWRMRAPLRCLHDGDLSPQRSRGLEAHLTRCPHCAAELRRLEAADQLLAAARPVAAPLPREESRKLFLAALESSGVQYRRSRWNLAWALPALGGVVLTTVGGARLAMPLFTRDASLPVVAAAVEPPVAAEVAQPEPSFTLPRLERPALLTDKSAESAEPVVPKRTVLASWGHRQRRSTVRRRKPARIHRLRRRKTPALVPLEAAPEASPDQGYLMLVVTSPPPPPQMQLTVRKLDESAPGYAHATALHWNRFGQAMVSEYTVASHTGTKLP